MRLARRSRGLAVAAALVAVAALAVVPVLAANAAVSIVQKSFTPAEVTIHAGETVTWTVTESIGEPHSVTSGKPADANFGSVFNSGLEGLTADGGSYQHTFAEPGTFDYFCTVHAVEMSGKVIVTAAEGGEGGEGGEGIPTDRKLLAAGILVATLIVGFGAAIVWRRMNPA